MGVMCGDHMNLKCESKHAFANEEFGGGIYVFTETDKQYSWFDILLPFKHCSLSTLKEGDIVVGTVDNMAIADDGTPGVFLKKVEIVEQNEKAQELGINRQKCSLNN